jgi:PAS domain S-box-containing protein
MKSALKCLSIFWGLFSLFNTIEAQGIQKVTLQLKWKHQFQFAGYYAAIEKQEEIIQLIYNKYTKRHSVEHLRFEAEGMKNLIMEDVLEIGYTNPGRWESIANIYKKLNMLKSSFSTNGLLYSDYQKHNMTIPWKMIFGFVLILFFIAFIAYFFYHSSRRFKNEIKQRILLEDDLKVSEKKYRLLTEFTADVIWVLNVSSGKFSYISPSVFQLRGFTAEEAILETLEDALTPDSVLLVNEAITKDLSNFIANPELRNYYINEIQQYCKNGEIIWVEVSTQFRYGPTGDIEIVGVSRNIEERKKAEAKILENEVELRSLNATKDKFFSIIAHDLKSPFNSIVGFSELLVAELKTKNYDEIETYANIILQSSERALNLLMNLMEWSRSQTGKMEFNPEYVEMGNLINEICLLFDDVASQKSIQINRTLPPDTIVFADRAMVSTVIRNLISNAIKFTNTNGEIQISAKQKNNQILISIKDNGVGMSKETIEKLFRIEESFSSKGTNNETGTGLGLLLCKEFVEKHGGIIWVESTVGIESTFFFSLPLSIKKRLDIDRLTA